MICCNWRPQERMVFLFSRSSQSLALFASFGLLWVSNEWPRFEVGEEDFFEIDVS